MSIVQVIIDRTTSMIIEGVYEFDRPDGGTLVAPSGSSFPASPVAGEWFWRSDQSILYRRDGYNTEWEAMAVSLHGSTHAGDGSDPVPIATTTVDGLMSAADKVYLDSLVGGDVRKTVHNNSGTAIAKGKLVAVTGWNLLHGHIEVDLADKDSRVPAVGITTDTIPDGTDGYALVVGTVVNIDTSAFALNDEVVLGTSGQFVLPPPGNDPFTGTLQQIGVITRVDATAGRMVVNISSSETLTPGQVFALQGDGTTPSKTNQFTTKESHLALRQLIHFIDGGPAEGFASGAYREMTGTVFPTAIIWYNQAGVGKKKIVSKEIAWSGAFPTAITWKVYDASETLLATVVDTIAYSGPFETSRTRTIS